MDHRYRRELTKLDGAQLPDDLWLGVQEGPRMAPLAAAGRSRVTAAVVAFAVFGLAAFFVWKAFTAAAPATQPAGSDAVAFAAGRDRAGVPGRRAPCSSCTTRTRRCRSWTVLEPPGVGRRGADRVVPVDPRVRGGRARGALRRVRGVRLASGARRGEVLVPGHGERPGRPPSSIVVGEMRDGTPGAGLGSRPAAALLPGRRGRRLPIPIQVTGGNSATRRWSLGTGSIWIRSGVPRRGRGGCPVGIGVRAGDDVRRSGWVRTASAHRSSTTGARAAWWSVGSTEWGSWSTWTRFRLGVGVRGTAGVAGPDRHGVIDNPAGFGGMLET